MQRLTCLGLDESKQRLLFYVSGPDARREVKIPLNVLRQCGKVTVTALLVDAPAPVTAWLPSLHRALHRQRSVQRCSLITAPCCPMLCRTS